MFHSSLNPSSTGHMQPHMSQQLGMDDPRAMAFKQGLPQLQTSAMPQLSPSSQPNSPSAYTPRKYLKALVHVLRTLIKHQKKLSGEFLDALKDLELVLNQAAHPYSSAATGKLHYYLIEDQQVQQLQHAGGTVYEHLLEAARLCSEADPDFQADICELADRLEGAKCILPAGQVHLIDAFRNLCHNMDPSYDIPDGVQKAAEHVVREVIKEVHGPFFNSEILEREVGYLVRIASRINPNAQRTEAATVKLLASTLLNLDGDESDDEDDFDGLDGPDACDPFMIPSFPSNAVRVRADATGSSGAASPAPLSPVCHNNNVRAACSSKGGPLDVHYQQHQQQQQACNSGYGRRLSSGSEANHPASLKTQGAASKAAAAAAKGGRSSGGGGAAGGAGGVGPLGTGDFRISATASASPHSPAQMQMQGSRHSSGGCSGSMGGYRSLHIDHQHGEGSSETYDSAVDSPTPTAASLSAAAVFEQQQAYQQQQQQQQQQGGHWQQQQQAVGVSGLPPKSPTKQQQMVPPLQLQQMLGQHQHQQQQHSQAWPPQQQRQQEQEQQSQLQQQGSVPPPQARSSYSRRSSATSARSTPASPTPPLPPVAGTVSAAVAEQGAAAAAAYLQRAARRSDQQQQQQMMMQAQQQQQQQLRSLPQAGSANGGLNTSASAAAEHHSSALGSRESSTSSFVQLQHQKQQQQLAAAAAGLQGFHAPTGFASLNRTSSPAAAAGNSNNPAALQSGHHAQQHGASTAPSLSCSPSTVYASALPSANGGWGSFNGGGGIGSGGIGSCGLNRIATNMQDAGNMQDASNVEAHGNNSSSSASMFKEFIDSNSMCGTPGGGASSSAALSNSEACTFQANIKLLDEGVERLSRFIESTRRVRGLSLAHNAIGPMGAQRLCKAMLIHRTVQSLDLPDNALGDLGAAAIADLLDAGCKITSLQLSDNDISDAGMVRLAQAIQASGRLERLSIYNNRIGSAGCRALVAAVKACRQLKVVEFLPGNGAATRDIKLLAQAVKRNRRFRIANLFTCSSCTKA